MHKIIHAKIKIYIWKFFLYSANSLELSLAGRQADSEKTKVKEYNRWWINVGKTQKSNAKEEGNSSSLIFHIVSRLW